VQCALSHFNINFDDPENAPQYSNSTVMYKASLTTGSFRTVLSKPYKLSIKQLVNRGFKTLKSKWNLNYSASIVSYHFSIQTVPIPGESDYPDCKVVVTVPPGAQLLCDDPLLFKAMGFAPSQQEIVTMHGNLMHGFKNTSMTEEKKFVAFESKDDRLIIGVFVKATLQNHDRNVTLDCSVITESAGTETVRIPKIINSSQQAIVLESFTEHLLSKIELSLNLRKKLLGVRFDEKQRLCIYVNHIFRQVKLLITLEMTAEDAELLHFDSVNKWNPSAGEQLVSRSWPTSDYQLTLPDNFFITASNCSATDFVDNFGFAAIIGKKFKHKTTVSSLYKRLLDWSEVVVVAILQTDGLVYKFSGPGSVNISISYIADSPSSEFF
jgi:hypothetical protein